MSTPPLHPTHLTGTTLQGLDEQTQVVIEFSGVLGGARFCGSLLSAAMSINPRPTACPTPQAPDLAFGRVVAARWAPLLAAGQTITGKWQRHWYRVQLAPAE